VVDALLPDLPCIAEHGPHNACPECVIEPEAGKESSPPDQTTDSASTY
jgi:hypothetical protein